MTTLGTFNADGLSAFTNKSGTQTMLQDGERFFVRGIANGTLTTKQVSEEYIVHRLMDTNIELTLTPEGKAMKAVYDEAASL